MKLLVITADDFGQYRDLDPGIRQVCEEGIVTHVSLVANGEGVEEAARFLADHPKISAGIHLNLTDGKPLSSAKDLRKLLGSNGNFFGNHLKVFIAYCRHPSLSHAIEIEYRAQIERLAALGVRIAQINGHGHLHLTPGLFSLVAKLAHEYKISFVRVVEEWPGIKSSLCSPKRSLIAWRLSSLSRKHRNFVLSEGETVKMNRSLGVLDSGHLTCQERLSEILSGLPEGCWELFCHPGTPRKDNPSNYDWDGERKLLISSQAKEEIKRWGIRLVNFWEVRDVIYKT